MVAHYMHTLLEAPSEASRKSRQSTCSKM